MSSVQSTILIVDDDPLHLTIYSWILQRQGYVCKTARVGSTEIEIPSEASIDLVLLDYRLNSSLTPLNVIQKLREKFAAVPIVILSEVQWMPDEMRGQATAFVSKGEPERLLETIHSVLQTKI